eukprot:3464046-Pleurochrysis_carterae.AAC.1
MPPKIVHSLLDAFACRLLINASKNGALKAVSEPSLRHPCLLHRSKPGASKAILLLISLDYLSALYQRQRVFMRHEP